MTAIQLLIGLAFGLLFVNLLMSYVLFWMIFDLKKKQDQFEKVILAKWKQVKILTKYKPMIIESRESDPLN